MSAMRKFLSDYEKGKAIEYDTNPDTGKALYQEMLSRFIDIEMSEFQKIFLNDFCFTMKKQH